MEIYQWLFRQNGYGVSDLGYFLYANGIKADNRFYSDRQGCEDVGVLEFATTLIPYNGNSEWVEETLFAIKEVLMTDELPDANESFDLNIYFSQRSKVERQLS